MSTLASVAPVEALAADLDQFGVALEPDAGRADARLVMSGDPASAPTIRLLPSPRPGHWRVTEEKGGGDTRLYRLVQTMGPTLDAIVVHAALAECAAPDRVAEELLGPLARDRDAARRWIATDLLFNSAPPEGPALAALIADAVFAIAAPKPAVSIVINNYNYAEFLGAAIESSLDQTVPAREVIVVDDGSTDRSRAVIARFPEVRAILKPNGGQGSAFNAGFGAAEGDVILFLDADDRLRPDAVEVLSAERWDSIARLSFGLGTIDAAGAPAGLFPTSRTAVSGELRGPLLSDGYLMMMPTSGMALPRDTLARLLPMPEPRWRISADVYLAFGAAFLGPARHLDRVLGDYRLHGRNAYYAALGTEASFNDRKMAQRRQAYSDLADLMERQPGVGCPRDAGHLRMMADPASPACRERLAHLDAVAPRRRLATPPLADGTNPDGPNDAHRAVLEETDPARLGGGATWPQLRPGERVDLTRRGRGRTPLGRGWTWRIGQGARLTGALGTLAVTLPGASANWAIRLSHSPLADPVPVETWVNGTRLDPLRPGPGGQVTLYVPADLLAIGETGDCRLDLHLVGGSAAGLVLTALRARPVPSAGTVAPVLRAGDSHRPDSPTGHALLGDGWDWPAGGAVQMTAPEATLWVSVAEVEDLDLHLDVDPQPMLVSVEGAAADVWPDAAGRGVHVPIAAATVPASGLVQVTLIAGAARPCLRALRLLLNTGLHNAGPPNRLVPMEEMPRRAPPGGDTEISVPLSAERLAVRLASTGTGSPSLTLAWRGRTLRCLGPATVILPPGPEATGPLLVSAAEGLSVDAVASDVPWPSAPDPAPAELLSPDALLSRAAVASDWHPAEEEAVWLASAAATLALTVPDGSPHSVAVAVLTLPETDQHLTLRCGTAVVRTTGQGQPETLTLPLGDTCGGDALVLTVETDTLVSPELLSLAAGPPLGGALLRVSFLREAHPPAPSKPNGDLAC